MERYLAIIINIVLMIIDTKILWYNNNNNVFLYVIDRDSTGKKEMSKQHKE